MKLAYIAAFNAMKEKLAEEGSGRIATPDSTRISKRTDPERKQLTAIINAWVGMAPIHYASARTQLNAHFVVTSVDHLTVAQVKDGIAWVLGKIDALPPAPQKQLPRQRKLRRTNLKPTLSRSKSSGHEAPKKSAVCCKRD